MSENARERFERTATNAAPEKPAGKPAPDGGVVESQSEYMARLEDENIAKGLIPGMPS
ncbi:MAG: hypothetical protein AB7E85_02950 [Pseudobdellovibrionaceae bacterium]